jgi:putative peptidoglycan lipid II flippase
MTTPSTTTSGNQIARAASTVMFAIIISNLVGLARQIIIAHAFGTGGDLEAFNAANRVGDLLFNLMAGGALASAFVPTFTGLLVRGEKGSAWRLASAIANLLVLILIMVCVITAIAAPWVVKNLLAPGFPPEKQILTAHLLRILLPSVVIFGLSGLVMGILNSNRRFLIPALTPAMYSLGMILGVIFFAPAIGIYAVAWGAVVGALFHLGLQVPSLIKLHGRYEPVLDVQNPLVRKVGSLMLPRLFGAAIVQLNFWVNTVLCSFQTSGVLGTTFLYKILGFWIQGLRFPFPEGSLNGVTYAFQLMLMPQAAIAQSIAIATMPTLSAQAALDKMEEFRSSLASSLRGMLLLAIPASIGLVLLRRPIIALLYQRGEFSTTSTELVAWPLLWFAAGLVGHSMVEVLSRAFYALHDTRTPVIIGAGAMTLNLIFSLWFTVLFTRIGWMPHGGLALANSLATALETIGLLIFLRRKIHTLQGKRILQLVWQAVLAGAVMAAALVLWIKSLSVFSTAIQALGGILLGGLVYGIILLLLKVPELLSLKSALLRRFKRAVTLH